MKCCILCFFFLVLFVFNKLIPMALIYTYVWSKENAWKQFGELLNPDRPADGVTPTVFKLEPPKIRQHGIIYF